MAYVCDSDDGNMAVLVVTNLDNGDTVAACPACVPPVLHGLATAFEAVLAPEPDGAAEAPQDAAEPPEADQAPNGAARPKRAAKRPTAPETAPEGAEAPAPAAPDPG